jgi:hypothetical protein
LRSPANQTDFFRFVIVAGPVLKLEWDQILRISHLNAQQFVQIVSGIVASDTMREDDLFQLFASADVPGLFFELTEKVKTGKIPAVSLIRKYEKLILPFLLSADSIARENAHMLTVEIGSRASNRDTLIDVLIGRGLNAARSNFSGTCGGAVISLLDALRRVLRDSGRLTEPAFASVLSISELAAPPDPVFVECVRILAMFPPPLLEPVYARLWRASLAISPAFDATLFLSLVRPAVSFSRATLAECFEQRPFFDLISTKAALVYFSHFASPLEILLPSSPPLRAVLVNALRSSVLPSGALPRCAPALVPAVWSALDRPTIQSLCDSLFRWASADQEPLHALNSLIGFVAGHLPDCPPLSLPSVPAALPAALERGAEALPALLVALARSPDFRGLLLIELRAFCGRSTDVALAATAFLQIASRAEDIDEFVRAHLMDARPAEFPRALFAALEGAARERPPWARALAERVIAAGAAAGAAAPFALAALRGDEADVARTIGGRIARAAARRAPADLEGPREWLVAIVDALPQARAVAAAEVPAADAAWVRAVRPGMLA